MAHRDRLTDKHTDRQTDRQRNPARESLYPHREIRQIADRQTDRENSNLEPIQIKRGIATFRIPNVWLYYIYEF